MRPRYSQSICRIITACRNKVQIFNNFAIIDPPWNFNNLARLLNKCQWREVNGRNHFILKPFDLELQRVKSINFWALFRLDCRCNNQCDSNRQKFMLRAVCSLHYEFSESVQRAKLYLVLSKNLNTSEIQRSLCSNLIGVFRNFVWILWHQTKNEISDSYNANMHKGFSRIWCIYWALNVT